MYCMKIALAAVYVVAVSGHGCNRCHTPICGENEVPVRGHPRRDKFCRPAYTPRDVFKQHRKCVCKPTYVRNSWDECVPRKLCRRCKCRLQKDWHMCSSACPVTSDMRLPFCSKMCVPGCDCPPGWVVDSRNWKRCVKAKKFPPVCPPHSTFQPCVSNCLPRCGIIAPKTCVSSCHRGACVCDEGFAEFWGYEGRLCVRQEKCEWHYRNLLVLIRTGSNGAGAGLPGGAIHPGGWIIGPWGAFLPSVIGLHPGNAGINGGSAFLTSMNTAGGAHSGARVGETSLFPSGAPGSNSWFETGGLNAGGASLGGGSVFHGSGIRGNLGSAALSTGGVVGGSSGGLSAGDTSLTNSAGLVGSSAGGNMRGTSLNGVAGLNGPGVGPISRGVHLGGNGSITGSGVSVVRGSESINGGGRVSGGAVSSEVASVGAGVGAGGTRLSLGNAGMPSVIMGAGGNSFSSSVTGSPPNTAMLSTTSTTSSGNTMENGNAGGSLAGGIGSLAGGIGAATHNAGSTGSVINGGHSSSRGTSGRDESQPSGNAGSGGHGHGFSGVSNSAITVGTNGEGANRNGGSGSLTATAGPSTTTTTTTREVVSSSGLMGHPATVSVALPAGGTSTTLTGTGVNAGGNGAVNIESSSLTTSSSSGTSRTGNTHSSISANSGGSSGSMVAGSTHSHGNEANGAVISITNGEGNGEISPGSATGAGLIGVGGNNGSAGLGSVRITVAPVPSGVAVVSSPGTTVTTGNTGRSTAGSSSGSVNTGPLGAISHVGTGNGGVVIGVTPPGTALTAVAGAAGVGRSGSETGVGPVVAVPPAGNMLGGAAAGTSPETTNVAGAAHTATTSLVNALNTAVTGATSMPGLTMYRGGTTSVRAGGSESSGIASAPLVTRGLGNGGHHTVFIHQPGNANSGDISYGVPPIPALRSISTSSAGLPSGPTAATGSTNLSITHTEGVDTGEPLPTTEVAPHH